MIDVHCHLNFHSFKNDYDQVIKSALQAGVEKIINTGTKLDSSEEAVALAHVYKELYAIVGVHPHHADKQDVGSDWLEKLEKLAKMDKVVGIGECGMDYYKYKSNGTVDPALQREFFEAQIDLAHRVNLPLQIHNRQAGEEVIEILKHHKNILKQSVPGMFHCFAGSMEVLKDALELGFYIGFDGNTTYEGLAPGETTDLKDIADFVPADRIVVETDSPFLTPEPHRGKRNEPKYVILIGEFLAQLKGVSFIDFQAQTRKNVRAIFGI